MPDIIIGMKEMEAIRAIEAANKKYSVRPVYEVLRPPTFRLTPRNSYYLTDPFDPEQTAYLLIYGAYFAPKPWQGSVPCVDFDTQHARDELFFDWWHAADPALGCSLSNLEHRRKTPHIHLACNLLSLAPAKLTLVFEYEALTESRVLVCGSWSNVGIGYQTLVPGSNAFNIEFGSIAWIGLFFIPVHLEGRPYGGNWFFKSISGYVD